MPPKKIYMWHISPINHYHLSLKTRVKACLNVNDVVFFFYFNLVLSLHLVERDRKLEGERRRECNALCTVHFVYTIADVVNVVIVELLM